MSYYGWQDGSKLAVAEKIAEAIDAYRYHKGGEPTEVLCHTSHEAALVGTSPAVPIRFVTNVTPAHFLVGEPDPPMEVALR